MYEIKQMFINQNRSGESLNPVGIVAHETANAKGAPAINHYNYYNENYVEASAHCFVDWNEIIQTIPFNEVAWHAGYTANHRFIGIEWCHIAPHDSNKFNELWKRGVWLYAYIFKNVLGITTVNDDNFWSHKRVSDTFRETNHQDPISFLQEYGKTWDDLKNAVQECINSGEVADINDNQGGTVEVNPILQLQKDLNQLCHVGADGNKLDEDGIWGTNTKFAMQDFQSKNGLEITDELDETTKQMLDKIIRDIPLPTSNENVEETPVKKSDVPYVIDLCQQGIKMQVFTDHLEIKWIGQDSWKIINFNN